MTKEELMHRAIELSKNSVKTGGGPFGAVIAKDGIIIAEASNSVTEHLDLVAVDREVLTVEDLNLGSETAVGRVVAQQVRVGFEVTESVDRNNLHIIPALFFVEGAENAAADAAKTVNGKTNSHL